MGGALWNDNDIDIERVAMNFATTNPVSLRHLDRSELPHYVARQLGHFFPLPGASAETLAAELATPVARALDRLGHCFAGIHRRKFQDAAGPAFNPLHPDHYAMFLYLLANSLHASRSDQEVRDLESIQQGRDLDRIQQGRDLDRIQQGRDLDRIQQGRDLAFRVYYLNKALHGVDVFPDVALPAVFQFMHATGTVIGNARFGGHFCIYQNCTVGSNEAGDYPEFGDGVVMYTGARVIGRCRVGSNVVIGANALIIDRDVPDNTVAIAGELKVRLLPNTTPVIERRFS